MSEWYNLIQCPSGRYTLAGWHIALPSELCPDGKLPVWETSNAAIAAMRASGITAEIRVYPNREARV